MKLKTNLKKSLLKNKENIDFFSNKKSKIYLISKLC